LRSHVTHAHRYIQAFYSILGRNKEADKCGDLRDEAARLKCQEEAVREFTGSFSTPLRSIRSSLAYMLGDFDLDELDGSAVPWLLSMVWALCMLIVTIILLNVLIAIISDRSAQTLRAPQDAAPLCVSSACFPASSACALQLQHATPLLSFYNPRICNTTTRTHTNAATRA
jgi:hypothetical protein